MRCEERQDERQNDIGNYKLGKFYEAAAHEVLPNIPDYRTPQKPEEILKYGMAILKETDSKNLPEYLKQRFVDALRAYGSDASYGSPTAYIISEAEKIAPKVSGDLVPNFAKLDTADCTG